MDTGLSRQEVARLLSDSGIQSPIIIDAVYSILEANNEALIKHLLETLRNK